MQGHVQLTARRHVQSQALLVGHAQKRLSPERLAGVDDLGIGVVGAEGLHVSAHGVAQEPSVVDDQRGPELLGERDHVASADGEMAVRGRGGRRWENL